MPIPRPSSLLLAGLLLFAGCLPYSCRRDGYTELLPADSLSRRIAQQTPRDTLHRVWHTTGRDSAGLQFPRTVRFGASGRLYVSDVERNSIFAFTPDGRLLREISIDAFNIPYLIGTRGDTLVVLNVGADHIALVHGNWLVRRLPVAVGRAERSSLLYGAASDTALYAKVVGDEVDNFIARLNREGEVAQAVPLADKSWRYAGHLRVWGDSLISLSGFRPVVDVLRLPLTDTTRVDSMALRGFDSPMLERSRAFVKGEITKAPLLSTAADPAGNRLFVLNLRPGWLQIDTYDHRGQIHHRLTPPDSAYEESFYPRDLAVQRRAGGYDIAVVFTEPDPRLDLYRWVPPSAPDSAATAQK